MPSCGQMEVGWKGLPKMSEAMDGRREAHTDVLEAVFGRPFQPTSI